MLEYWVSGGAVPFAARKKFTLTEKPTKAALSICGLGQFAAFLNGEKLGDHELDPAWTDYRKYIQYVVFDCTEALKAGENVLAAEVGNGWYIKTDEHYTFAFPPFMPPNPNPYRPFGEALVLSFELTAEYADGRREIVTSEDGVKTAPHFVTMSNVYGSETIDRRVLSEHWTKTEFDDAAWQKAAAAPKPEAELCEQYQNPIKVLRRYEAKPLGRIGSREIFDLGQNVSSLLCLKAKGERGSVLRLYPAEKLAENGDVDQRAKNWCDVDVCVSCILAGEGEEEFRMHFTYAAGRYIAVETEGNAELLTLCADAISSGWKRDGDFDCDDERYRKIYDMIEKTVEANLLGVHTDCPTIERFAWQEPNHLMAGAIFYMKDGSLLWDKFLRDMRAAQHTKEDYFFDFAGNRVYPGEGLMPSQCPCYIPNVLPVPGLGDFYDIIPWGSTSILGAWKHYEFYGSLRILEENYAAGRAYLKHCASRRTPEGFLNYGLGDWGNPRQELCRENIETAFLYADAVTLAKMADCLQKEADRAELLAFAEEVRENYNARLLTKHPKGYYCYRCADHPDELFLTQAAQALPLYWGMVPEELEGDIAQALRDTLEREGAFLCGEVGLPYVIQCASRYGMDELICRFITRTEHPSYYAFVLDGETTLGEYWEHNPRSHCHDMMGHIIEWYYNGLAGIRPTRPGFAAVEVQPYLPESMNTVKAVYRSVSGEIAVELTRTADGVHLKVRTPKDVKTEIRTDKLQTAGRITVEKEQV